MCVSTTLNIDKILSLTPMISKIKALSAPVLLYGMGKGAELTHAYLKSHGITPEGVFASDGFVRGQEFMGQKVMSVCEAEQKYGSFTAVLSFALEGDKMSTAFEFAKSHRLFCPSICPFSGVFDYEYVKSNADSLSWLYSRLSDDASKAALHDLLCFFVSGSIEYALPKSFTPPEEYLSHPFAHIDIGAYNGETALEYLKANKDCKNVYAFEPDPTTFAKLVQNTKNFSVTPVNAAVCDRDGSAVFSAKASRASSLLWHDGDQNVQTVSLDGYFNCNSIKADKSVGSIRIDGEGVEDLILNGAATLLYTSRPVTCCAVYHRASDLTSIPKRLTYLLSGCRFYLEVKPYLPAFDIFIYAVPTLR